MLYYMYVYVIGHIMFMLYYVYGLTEQKFEHTNSALLT